jgi:aspartate dehydrogenase
LRVGIAGFGAVGRSLALALQRGIDGLSLAAIASRDVERVRAALPQGAAGTTPIAVVPIA